jgi:hypothetical protein
MRVARQAMGRAGKESVWAIYKMARVFVYAVYAIKSQYIIRVKDPSRRCYVS